MAKDYLSLGKRREECFSGRSHKGGHPSRCQILPTTVKLKKTHEKVIVVAIDRNNGDLIPKDGRPPIKTTEITKLRHNFKSLIKELKKRG